jgi:hypothetical protein
VRPLGAATTGQSIDIGTFLMEPGTLDTTDGNPTVHYEPLDRAPTFDVQLRADGQAPTCGTLSG